MNEFTRSVAREPSVPLPVGGDAYFHPWWNRRGFTATTRLPEGPEFHEDFRYQEMLGQRTPPPPGVLGQMPW